jgi:hypothetical protein
MSDDAKKLVLARRARFVAAALAGMTIGCGKENAPHPCLDVPPGEDANALVPQVCLTAPVPSPPPPDASSDASSDAASDAAIDAGSDAAKAKPRPHGPKPCLLMFMLPKDDDE